MGLQMRHIDGKENLPHYFLCNYIPQSRGSDKLSKSLLGFKQGLYPHKQAWIDCSFTELKIANDFNRFLILRALGSDEQNVSGGDKPLDELGQQLAKTVSGNYSPSLLLKTKVVTRMKSLPRAEREHALNGAYKFLLPDHEVTGVLILDDILTTGTTLKSIAKAIRDVLPSLPIKLVTLAFTHYNEQPNEGLSLMGNAYLWEKKSGWTVAAEDDEPYHPSIEVLKQQILSDSFETNRFPSMKFP